MQDIKKMGAFDTFWCIKFIYGFVQKTRFAPTSNPFQCIIFAFAMLLGESYAMHPKGLMHTLPSPFDAPTENLWNFHPFFTLILRQSRPSPFDAPTASPRCSLPFFILLPDARGGLAIDLPRQVHPSSAQVAPTDADLLSEIQAFSMASYQSV